MRTVFLIILVVCFLAVCMIALPVSAEQTRVSASHELEIQLSGEWNLDSSTRIPSASYNLTLEGIGDALIRSHLVITEETRPVSSWWDLF